MKQITLKSLFEFKASDDPNNLVGNRFLCKHGTLMFVGSSGIGKSTFCLQMCGKFALGLDFLGIRPARELKTVYIQAENDLGDMAEIFQGLCSSLGIKSMSTDARLLHKNLKIFSEDLRSGEAFLESLETVLKKESPDIILVDPLLSYIGGDINQQEVVSKFLRNGLNPLLRKYGAACIMIHHTKKGASDDSYAAIGSSELVNHARAVINLVSPKSNPNCDIIFEATKRGKRLGLKNAIGESCHKLEIRYGATGTPDFQLVQAISFEESKASAATKHSSSSGVAERHARIKEYIDSKMKKPEAIAKIAKMEGVSPKTAGRDYDKLFCKG